jgi:hypothetical protein
MGLMLTGFKRLKPGPSGEQDNELWGPIKYGEFLKQLINYQLLKKDTASYNI